jgi:ribonuclease D
MRRRPATCRPAVRGQDSSNGEGAVIEIKQDLTDDDVERLRRSQVVALDTETAGLIPGRDPLYLVQVCDRDGVVDILRRQDGWGGARNVIRVLRDPEIVKVIQFAVMDCAFLLKNMGAMPVNVYCTKIASKLARTYSSGHSLSAILEDVLGVVIDKRMQTTFWGKARLSEDQLRYAAADVTHLIEARNRLEALLVEKGTLPTGLSYADLNRECQSFIPVLVHLWVNGWDIGKEEPQLIFGH